MHTSRTEIAFEQQETWRIRHSGGFKSTRCPYCVEDSPMVAAEIAARVFDLSPREIYRLVEEGAIHFLETPELNVLICLGSFDEKRLSSAGLSNSHLDCTTVFGI